MQDEFGDVYQAQKDSKRRKLTKTEKLAAVICQMMVVADAEAGIKAPLINPDWAKRVSAKDIVAMFERWHRWDHRIPLGIDGTNHPTNIDPLPRLQHEAVKTPLDLKAIAKSKRLQRKNAGVTAKQLEFRSMLLAPAPREAVERPKRKGAAMPGTKASNWKHSLDGTWSRREKA